MIVEIQRYTQVQVGTTGIAGMCSIKKLLYGGRDTGSETQKLVLMVNVCIRKCSFGVE